ENLSSRDGSRARIRAVRKVVKHPTRARSRAAAGRRAVPGTPTTRSPAPTMNAISVVSAVRQTMRRGNSTGLLPYIDLSVRGNDDVQTARAERLEMSDIER